MLAGIRRAAQHDTCVSGKRCNAAGRVPSRTEGREKFVTGGVPLRLWYTYHSPNRSYTVTNFSPVKQVNINVPWYYAVGIQVLVSTSESWYQK
jgi:hypothetical protein